MGSRVRWSYDVVAERYANAVDRELDHRPLERALFAALPDLAGLTDAPGAVADLVLDRATSPATCASSAS